LALIIVRRRHDSPEPEVELRPELGGLHFEVEVIQFARRFADARL